MYYSGNNNINGAVINIDWEKAFDRVNWEFLIKIMHKMKFPTFIIKWLMTLYTNIESVCMVNGHFTDSFNVYRGVRQGCPLSMLILVLFQNPLYLAIEKQKFHFDNQITSFQRMTEEAVESTNEVWLYTGT